MHSCGFNTNELGFYIVKTTRFMDQLVTSRVLTKLSSASNLLLLLITASYKCRTERPSSF